MRSVAIAACIALVTISVTGCGVGKQTRTQSETKAVTAASLPTSVPKPDLSRIVPANFQVEKILYAHLTGQRIPEAVVVSKGPAVGDFGFHPAQLQILSWDEIAERWNVVFDAQKHKAYQQQFGTVVSNAYISPPTDLPAAATPILDREADGEVNQIAFVRFGGEKTPSLVFTTAQSYGGSGTPGNLVVIGFQNDEADVRYLWFGDGGASFRVAGGGDDQRLVVNARFWTPVDAHCCPIRNYSFVVGKSTDGLITSIRDDRSWLGVFVRAVQENEPGSSLEVVETVEESPAASALREGDVITAVVGAKASQELGSLGPALVDQIALQKAGDEITLRVRRDDSTITVKVRLGSLIDPSALAALPPDDLTVMAI